MKSVNHLTLRTKTDVSYLVKCLFLLQNNVAAAENAEAEELLSTAPPWCYNEAGVVTACSPVADRVIRSGVYELQVYMPRCADH